MMAVMAWGGPTLLASAFLMLLVLLIRAAVRRMVGPRLGYWLWALPALRMIMPPLPYDLLGALQPGADAASKMAVLFQGPGGSIARADGLSLSSILPGLLAFWGIGAAVVFLTHAIRHWRYCRGLRAAGAAFGEIDGIPVIATAVDGPLAFGVWRRCIAVPRSFDGTYSPAERDLALAHEQAHHLRGDLTANWAALGMLAAHWWNPVAWGAMRAFREDQELAADAHVLAGKVARTRALYAHVLAKAAGVGALPACNLHSRANLKGRLMMIHHKPNSVPRLMLGGAAIALLGTAALAATASRPATGPAASGSQAVTIGVKPDGSGSYALVVGHVAVRPGSALPNAMTLPGDFSKAGGCDLRPGAKPFAMVIKGSGTTQTYTVMCASAGKASVDTVLAEGLASLRTMRASVATQPASASFPEPERAHALGAIDRSIKELQETLAAGR